MDPRRQFLSIVIVFFFALHWKILFIVAIARKSEKIWLSWWLKDYLGHCIHRIFFDWFSSRFTNISHCDDLSIECEEYGKLVYEIEPSPVLRIGAGFNVVSRCAIVGTPLIVGGIKAKMAEFPHMAVIGFGRNLSDVSWLCGGSIISERYILTAAHCLESRDNGPALMVRVGTTNLEIREDSLQERKIIRRIKHPDYKLPAKYHDLGLIELDKPLELNPNVRPACLEMNFQPPGKQAIATGFGRTSYGEMSMNKDLMKVQLDYINEESCKKRYQFDLGHRYLPNGFIQNFLCAGMMEGGKDTCQGDSGGPLQRVLEHPYCTYSIVGVTSFGKFCAMKNSPAIYTRVSSYLDWIESIVWP